VLDPERPIREADIKRANRRVRQGPLPDSCILAKSGFVQARAADRRRADTTSNVDFEGRTKMFVSLFQIRRQHTFDPFHECADSARQIAPMCYDEGHGERPATKIGYDLHKRSTF
jgi:hypothetical protein